MPDHKVSYYESAASSRVRIKCQVCYELLFSPSDIVVSLLPKRPNFQHALRQGNCGGGGVSLLSRSNLSVNATGSTQDNMYMHFGHMICTICTCGYHFK